MTDAEKDMAYGVAARPQPNADSTVPEPFPTEPEQFGGPAASMEQSRSRPCWNRLCAEPADGVPLSARRVRLVLAGLMFTLLLGALDQSIIATALPKIVGQLHVLNRMSWVDTAYLLASILGLPVHGKLGDLFGRESLFPFVIITFVVGLALAGWSRNMNRLIAFRGLQGIGGGGLMIGVQAITADSVLTRRRGCCMGLIGAAFGFVGMFVSVVLFLPAERFAAEPLIPLRLFRAPVSKVSSAVGAVTGLAGYLPTFLQIVYGTSAAGSGMLMLPMTGGVVGSVVAGHLISRSGGPRRVYPVIGCGLATAGMWPLSRLHEHTPCLAYNCWMAVPGVGVGLALPVLVLAVQNAVRPANIGVATYVNNHFRQVGGSVGTAVFGTLFADRLRRLTVELQRAARLPGPDSIDPEPVRALTASLRDGCVRAYAAALPHNFLYFDPVLLLGFLTASHPKAIQPVIPNGPAHAPDTAPATSVPRTRAAGPGVAVCGRGQHTDGTVVVRAALTLIDAAERQVCRGATGDDGRYALAVPGRGAYVPIAAADGRQPQAVAVTMADRTVAVHIVPGDAGRLAGVIRTADGTLVTDAVVTLTDVRGDVIAGPRSGRDGFYALSGLIAGEFTLAVGACAFRPAALPVSGRALRETRRDIELAGGAVLRGVSRVPGVRLVDDAWGTLLDAAGTVVDSVTTGADNVFRFVDLAVGSYTVIASGRPPVATVLQVTGGGRTEHDVQLSHED